MGKLSFHPITLSATWNDRRFGMMKEHTIPISLPSGVGPRDVSVEIKDDSTVAEIEIT